MNAQPILKIPVHVMSATFFASSEYQVLLNARYRDEMIDPFSTYHKSKKIRVKTFFLVALCTLKCVEDIFISFFIF